MFLNSLSHKAFSPTNLPSCSASDPPALSLVWREQCGLLNSTRPELQGGTIEERFDCLGGSTSPSRERNGVDGPIEQVRSQGTSVPQPENLPAPQERELARDTGHQYRPTGRAHLAKVLQNDIRNPPVTGSFTDVGQHGVAAVDQVCYTLGSLEFDVSRRCPAKYAGGEGGSGLRHG